MRKKILIQKYIRQIRSLLPRKGSWERNYLKKLKAAAEEYCGEHEVGSLEDLYQALGSPEDTLLDYYGSTDLNMLTDALRFRTYMKRWLIALTVAAVIGVAVFCFIQEATYRHFREQAIVGTETILPVAAAKSLPAGKDSEEKGKHHIVRSKTVSFRGTKDEEFFTITITASFAFDGSSVLCTGCSSSAESNSPAWTILGLKEKAENNSAAITASVMMQRGLAKEELTKTVQLVCTEGGEVY